MKWNPTGWTRGSAAVGLAVLICAGASGAADGPASPRSQDAVVIQDDFESGDLKGWDFTDPAAWRVVEHGEGGNYVLELFQASKYEPAVRSPFNIALVKDVELGAFVLDVKVRSTTRDYGHRDLCFIFGHQDPSHFYYVHLAKEADPRANSVFLVNGEPRVSIAETRTSGTNWTDDWRHVRVIRDPDGGLIEVYLDDMTKPVMTAHDKTFARGRIGLGSFDDAGMFDDLVVKSRDRGAVGVRPD